MIKSKIGDVIDSKGLKHKWVAEQVGVYPTVLSRWINNRGKPSLERTFKLAKVLNCKVDDLYTYEDDIEV
ncbi:helix-turn-helix transcriptional regulator [Oceanobacillus kimchii]|uniref:helix-turn-helix transcriptional regulator n=1 Tax=Oceanobacillus kimchii TaxID=746691 RepID=UPI002331328F|nr:helix-turn-helix transcriptional regulator [Oceanobacillus kimchii]